MQRICIFILLGLMSLSLGTIKKAHIVSLLQVFYCFFVDFFFALRAAVAAIPTYRPRTPACMPGLEVLIRLFSHGKTVARRTIMGAQEIVLN